MLKTLVFLAAAASALHATPPNPTDTNADILYVIVDSYDPQDPVRTPVVDIECECKASYTETPAPMISVNCPDGSTYVILVSPREQATQNGPCQGGESCSTQEGSTCRFTGKVKISYPDGASCPMTLWVRGGTTFPNPTPINQTEETSLDFTATCDDTGTEGGNPHTNSGKVEVWTSNPGANPPVANWTYSVTLKCAKCAEAGN